MAKNKTVLFLGDGMAGEPLPELGGKTTLEAAEIRAMDTIARNGRSGTLLTLPAGFPTSSDVANMSVLGCDLAKELCGRGPLEAAAQGIALGKDDVCFRVNIVTVDENGILRDYAGGHPSQEEAQRAIDKLNAALGSEKVRFYRGVSYRNLLVLHGAEFDSRVHCDKPDDNTNNPVAEHLPKADCEAAEFTAATLRKLIAEAPVAIWPWSGGKLGSLHKITELYNIRAAVISAVDVINGIGSALGMDVVRVPTATGYIDTDYEAKADAAIEALKDHDFVYVHIEATDEVSHAQDAQLKIKVLEDFDKRLVQRVLDKAPAGTAFAVLPDHPVPIALGKHTRTPVPVAVWQPGVAPDGVEFYSERLAPEGALGAMRSADLMDLLLK